MSLPVLVCLIASALLNIWLAFQVRRARNAVIIADVLLRDTRAELEQLLDGELRPQAGGPSPDEAEILQLLEDIERDARSKEELSPLAASARDEWLAQCRVYPDSAPCMLAKYPMHARRILRITPVWVPSSGFVFHHDKYAYEWERETEDIAAEEFSGILVTRVRT